MDIIQYHPERFDHLMAILGSNPEPFTGDPDAYPALGFLVFDSATPVAAGFLRMVEGGFAQIDTLTSNKGLSSSMRHEGISMVVDHLIKQAKVMKLKGIYAHTKEESVLRRAAELGFRHVPEVIIALPL